MIARTFKSESIKLINSYILYLHVASMIIFPTLLAVFFGINHYPLKSFVLLPNFFLVISFVSPVVISIVASMVNDRETKAGNYKNLLDTSMSPLKVFQSQIAFYWLLYLIEIILSFAIYGLILNVVFNVAPFPYFILLGFCILFSLLALIQYEVCFLASYIFGTAGSLVLGFAGLILSALSETVIFDNVWEFIPWSWQIRSIAFFQNGTTLNESIHYALLYIFSIIISLVLLFICNKIFSRILNKN
ncbi:ABC transporter permease [Apilactobacillus kunkeei]|uniref:ABC transporter permease n=1 Tax=Apilactobacillus kunkeei TaxID=148814 RepID=UPI00200A1F80|nr:ABC transporter permease [Apilactobacillus kunkeei]MCK8635993.1 ABC transporter permease [Apilactobacillus kunkeei]